jgi:hypothetical protein
MKKSTWVIIGLSVCVAVLATALGIVLIQKEAETITVNEPDFYKRIEIFSEPLLERRSFRIAGPYKTKSGYYTPYNVKFAYPEWLRESEKKVDLLGEKIPGFPGAVMLLKRKY